MVSNNNSDRIQTAQMRRREVLLQGGVERAVVSRLFARCCSVSLLQGIWLVFIIRFFGFGCAHEGQRRGISLDGADRTHNPFYSRILKVPSPIRTPPSLSNGDVSERFASRFFNRTDMEAQRKLI
jgi:hypothetical protein